MNVVVRTHGGLGNQLFQLLCARLHASASHADLFELHDSRYRHGFTRSVEIPVDRPPPAFLRFVSEIRLPKIATRLKFRRDALTLFGTIYLDGYFQDTVSFAPFDDILLRQQLLRLREELKVPAVPAHDRGMHLRLGDFFTSEAAITAHLEERLKRIGSGVGIVTNEEDRLTTPAIGPLLAAARARVVPTGDMSPEQVLRTLASFHWVDGNDSTLLFWASVLSGMQCNFSSPELRALRERFVRVLENR